MEPLEESLERTINKLQEINTKINEVHSILTTIVDLINREGDKALIEDLRDKHKIGELIAELRAVYSDCGMSIQTLDHLLS